MASILLSPPGTSNSSKEDDISSLEWELGKLSSQLDWIESYKHQLEDRIECCQKQIHNRKDGKRSWWQTLKQFIKSKSQEEPVHFS